MCEVFSCIHADGIKCKSFKCDMRAEAKNLGQTGAAKNMMSNKNALKSCPTGQNHKKMKLNYLPFLGPPTIAVLCCKGISKDDFDEKSCGLSRKPCSSVNFCPDQLRSLQCTTFSPTARQCKFATKVVPTNVGW